MDTDKTLIASLKPDPQFNTEPASISEQNHTYALRVLGDSMLSDTADSFPNGSIIIVDPGMQAQPGDYVIVLNSDKQTTFKQLVQDGAELFLKPLNPSYPTEPLGSATIVGVVREVTKRFR